MEASPYIKVYNKNFVPLGLQVEKFNYVYSEKLDDESTIILRSNDASYADNKYLQEDEPLFLEWGYLNVSTSKTIRKVYIFKSECTFDNNGVMVVLSCYPKASYLKYNSKKQSRETSLDLFAKDAANNIGLNTIIDVNDENYIYKTGFPRRAKDITQIYINPDDPNDPRNGQTIVTGRTEAIDSSRRLFTYTWKREAIAQANRSDAAQMEEMRKNEPIDNLTISGRDDDLNITTRDFNQKPIKSYKWNVGNGDLLKFVSGIDNIFKRSKSMEVTASGWDPETKEFIQVDMAATDEGNPALAEKVALTLAQTLEKEEGPYPGNVRYEGIFEEYDTFDSEGNPIKNVTKSEILNGKSKYLVRIKKGYVPSAFIYNSDSAFINGYALEQDVVSRIGMDNIIPVSFQQQLDSIEAKAEDVLGSGIQERAENALEYIKSSAIVIGHPSLVSGKLVRMEGVGKKFSGNWYIVKASHDLDPQKGFLVTLDLSRNAIGETDTDNIAFDRAVDLYKDINNSEPEPEDLVELDEEDDS